ncbi:YsnF/AvaK domain-containing protein [Cryptosporangium sp. NPDC048952]|uniref:YsnF/AvaK domain-containing protein n=1 Tax=Cryptosporangium sp. NPDC048952 TaxID=3363961 RepID=UPI003721A7E3
MTGRWNADDLLDREVVDRHGSRIGRIDWVYLDAQSADPTFVAINTGPLSRSPSVVPLAGATARDDVVVLPLDRDRVKGAPTVEPAGRNGGLSLGQEQALYTFYGVHPGGDDAMTRSEEQLNVHTEEQPVARARLRKYTVTEEVQVTVPVTREEFRVEYEPVTGDEPDDTPADDPADDPGPMTLHSERVVVRTETVPTERVHLATDRVTEQQTVEGQVRREKIELDGDAPRVAEPRKPPGRSGPDPGGL